MVLTDMVLKAVIVSHMSRNRSVYEPVATRIRYDPSSNNAAVSPAKDACRGEIGC